ncbi:hypothetical protein [Streptomyces sp. NPDC004270]
MTAADDISPAVARAFHDRITPRRAHSADRSPALAPYAAPHQVRAEHPGREEQFGAFMHIRA